MKEKTPVYLQKQSFLDTLLSMFNLFPEFNESALVENPSEVMHSWRERALIIVVLASLIANLPVTLAAFRGQFELIPQWAGNLVFFIYLPCVIFSLVKGISLTSRIYILFSAKAVIGAIQFLTTQLIGSGRLTLAFLPVTALIIGGNRFAGHILLLCFSILGSITYLVTSGVIAPLSMHVENIAAGYWLFQVAVWVGNIFPQLYLIGHFLRLQDRTVDAVRAARDRIEAEITRNRLLEAELNRIGEEERRKLGAELHDGLCQHLTATLLNCSALEYQMKATAAPDLGSVEKIRGAVEKSIGMAYEVARGLCPVNIESDALVPALHDLCRAVRQRNGIGCKLQADHEINVVTPAISMHLYRIASESLTNAVKHSGCSEIFVKLCIDKADLVLEIADNGKGVPDNAEFSRGMGLNIMKYRAGLIGGVLEINSSQTGGTRVVCRLPAMENTE